MRFRDYIDAVVRDLRDAILGGDYDDRIDVVGETFNGSIITPGDVWEPDVDAVLNDLYFDDSVTGNGSGSYTFNACEAERNVEGLLFDYEFTSECDGCGIDVGNLLNKGPEAVDVTARCLALGFVDSDVRDAMVERREDILSDIYDSADYRAIKPLEYIAAGCLDRMEAVEVYPDGIKDPDGFAVAVCDSQTGLRVWVDVNGTGDDVETDWNQYIFDLTNDDDVWRRGFQSDVTAFDVCTSLAIDAVRDAGYMD